MTLLPRLLVVWTHLDSAGTADRLLRKEVARWSGGPPSGVQVGRLCPRCGSSRHGRPVVATTSTRARPAPWVSLSRTAGATVVALSEAGPVGVDVEEHGAAGFPHFPAVALHPREQRGTAGEQTVTWVRKEALLKALGWGLGLDPARFRLTPAAEPPSLSEWEVAAVPEPRVQLRDVHLGPGHTAAVCVLSAETPRVSVRQARWEGSAARAATATT